MSAELDTLKARVAELENGLRRIVGMEDAPEIDAIGDRRLGLHCGVEDRMCSDRYDGADFGYSEGVERGLEWAKNMAETALEKAAISKAEGPQ